jgi:hypothetical protein
VIIGQTSCTVLDRSAVMAAERASFGSFLFTASSASSCASGADQR